MRHLRRVRALAEAAGVYKGYVERGARGTRRQWEDARGLLLVLHGIVSRCARAAFQHQDLVARLLATGFVVREGYHLRTWKVNRY